MLKRSVLSALIGLSLFGQKAGRGIPDLTEQQTAALTAMNAKLAPEIASVSAARTAIVRIAFAEPQDIRAIENKAEGVRTAELALARARATEFGNLQTSAAKLGTDQTSALIAAGGVFRSPQADASAARHAGGRGTVPGIHQSQISALTRLSTDLMPLVRALTSARAELVSASLAQPQDQVAIDAKAEALNTAELSLAKTRAAEFSRIQSSPDKLSPEQVVAFVEMGGSFSGLGFTQPEPLKFADHGGFISLFNGVSLKGWDGNPKFWRVEGGAIVGESTLKNPSGNSYLVFRDLEAQDFTLKFEIKVEGSGGSGFQYRSKTGLPWLSNIPDNVTANVGSVDLNWMMTGPQADFWPASQDWTGQFYSENTPMRILAWRGQVVEGAGLSRKRLMGSIGDREALGRVVRMNDWNEYTVIARRGTCMHIVNGQLMAVMVDDDPDSSNNQPGLFGIEIEATTKSVGTQHLGPKDSLRIASPEFKCLPALLL